MRFLIAVPLLLALSPAQAQKFPAAVRQQDLNYVATQVPNLHPNFFYQLDRTKFQDAVNNLTAKIGSLTDSEFYVQLAALIAMAGDAHTSIYLNGTQAARAGFQNLPLQYRWLDDGVFVSGAASAYSKAIGAQLVRVGSMPIDQVLQKLGTIIPHDNDLWLRYMAQQYLTSQQILEGLDIVSPAAATPLTFRSLAGDEFTLNVAATGGSITPALTPNGGPLPDYLSNSSLLYWVKYIPEQRLLYFKYNVCGDDPSNPFAAFTATVMNLLDGNPVDSFVIDFRGNTGGSTSYFTNFGFEFAPRLPGLLKNPNFRLYIAIDKGTFSSGMDDAAAFKSSDIPAELESLGLPADLDLSKRIFVIGEPTGGKPHAYGNVLPFTLSGSGLVGQYSTSFVDGPAGIPDLPSFYPDIAIGIRSTDYFARFDPVMAAIIARSAGAPQPPSGAAITVNAASFRINQGVSAGSFAAVFGTFGSVPDEVLVNGTAAKIVSAAASQVNFVVPPVTAVGRATVVVRSAGAELARGQATISPAGPGIFVLNPADRSQPGAIENQDYSVNAADMPAAKGSVIQIFATGYGALDSSGAAPVLVMAGDIPAQVLYSAPVPEYPGLWQINAQLPASAVGQVPIWLVAGGLASNGVTIQVR